MTDREKFTKLIYDHTCLESEENDCGGHHDCSECLADFLIANGATFQKWIPVSERLPDSQGTYLCRYGFGQFADYMITGCIDWIAFDKHPHWQHASTGLFVTHWMPLPEPPKEE